MVTIHIFVYIIVTNTLTLESHKLVYLCIHESVLLLCRLSIHLTFFFVRSSFRSAHAIQSIYLQILTISNHFISNFPSEKVSFSLRFTPYMHIKTWYTCVGEGRWIHQKLRRRRKINEKQGKNETIENYGITIAN